MSSFPATSHAVFKTWFPGSRVQSYALKKCVFFSTCSRKKSIDNARCVQQAVCFLMKLIFLNSPHTSDGVTCHGLFSYFPKNSTWVSISRWQELSQFSELQSKILQEYFQIFIESILAREINGFFKPIIAESPLKKSQLKDYVIEKMILHVYPKEFKDKVLQGW